MWDYIGRGPTKASRHNAGKANTIDVPVIGIVKDNIDPTRSGRIKVFLSTNLTPLDPDNSDNWTPVSYLSGFFGSVRPSGGEEDFGSYKRNPSSYGEWHSPPDIGTQVICIFVNGDPNYGYYIGCIPQPEDLYMVPAIGSSENIIANEGEAPSYGGAVRLPVTNFNTTNKEIADSPDYVEAPRPVHSYTAAIMAQQGIIRDPIRGPISSSSQREAASRVGWGVSTPGRPIYEGGFNDETVTQNLDPSASEQLRVISRRGGHSIVMDDGDVVGRDQLVRIRTALGHQILMSDDGQTLMILHSNGQSYIELGKEGTVDVYSTNSINMRTDGDINFHAGQNINFHANEDINTRAKNFQVDTVEELRLRAEEDLKLHAFGNFTAKSDGDVAIASTGDSSVAAGGDAYVEGAKVNLNSGSAATQPREIEQIPLLYQTDTLFDKQQGFIAAPGKLQTITTRTPAHAPWAGAGQGVDVESSVDAQSQLPKEPSSGVKNTNNVALQSLSAQAGRQTLSAVTPGTSKAISSALDQNTTKALLNSQAAETVTNSYSAATVGVGFSGRGASREFVVGTYGQTPKQLSSAGYIKPGADRRIDALTRNDRIPESGQEIQEYKSRVMPAKIFSGKPGAKNIQSFTTNVPAQANAAINNLKKAQKSMTSMGAITGKEAPSQVASLVSAAGKFGPNAVKNAIRQIGNSGSSGGVSSNLLQSLGKGSFAAQVATTVTGGQGGIASALRLLDSTRTGGLLDTAKGVDGSAFNAIKQSFAPLQANVPQNLKEIAQQAGYGPVTGNTDLLSQTASIVQRGAQASTSSLLASGINNLPGGQKIVSAVLNNATNAVNNLPGTSGIKSEINRLLQGQAPSINLTSPGALVNSATNEISSNTELPENLRAGSIAQVQSAASALSSGTGSTTKLPTASFNTFDRKEISAKVDSLLYDPGIPPPNLIGEVSDEATQALDSVEAEGQEVFGLLEQFEDYQQQINSARNEYYELQATLPEGDPRIQEAGDAWFAIIDSPEYQQLLQDIAEKRGTGVDFLNEDQVLDLVNQSDQGQEGRDIDWNNLGRGSNDDATGIG